MEIEVFALCDAATESGGKLNILGTFDRIAARQLPVLHSHCAVALRIRFERIESGDHRVRLNFVDMDGQPVIPPLDGQISMNISPEARSLCANLILNLNNLRLERGGEYSIDLAIDGRQVRSLPLFVSLVEKKPETPADTGNTP